MSEGEGSLQAGKSHLGDAQVRTKLSGGGAAPLLAVFARLMDEKSWERDQVHEKTFIQWRMMAEFNSYGARIRCMKKRHEDQ